jgi:hypothetical protein
MAISPLIVPPVKAKSKEEWPVKAPETVRLVIVVVAKVEVAATAKVPVKLALEEIV